MFAPPPGLFTTVIVVGTILFALSRCSSMRAVLSLLPPGAEAATISTFLVGTQDCADAQADAAIRAMPAAYRLILMTVLSQHCFDECGPHRVGLPDLLHRRKRVVERLFPADRAIESHESRDALVRRAVNEDL